MPRLKSFDSNPMRSRQDFQQCARDLFEPLVPYLKDQGAAIDFQEGGAHFDMRAASLEGVARPLWAIVPLTAGGGSFEHWPLLRQALVEGTSPDAAGFWGYPGDIDQRCVEMAAIAFMLMLTPQEGWAPLSPKEKENLAQWLSRIQGPRMPQNNWLFFTVLVQEALKSVDRHDLVDEALEADYLDRLANWYRGDGWYGDGEAGTVDHYGGFAMHFYGLVYACFAREPDERLARLFKERARAFAAPFSRWFADDGECLAQGRSLTYRFATGAFWGILAAAEETPISIGTIKGLWARQLRSWKNKPIFTADGLLTRGYDYPNLLVCEEYNSPTSPYWAMKFFAPLMLPETSAFWTCGEEALVFADPVDAVPAVPAISQRVEGHAIVHYAAPVHRKVQSDKYNKFAYSTRFGLDVNALQYSQMGRFGDNILAFSFDQGANWQARLQNEEAGIDENGRLRASWWSGTQQVETVITVLANGFCIRTHRFNLEKPALVVDSGFAIDTWYKEEEIVGSILPTIVNGPTKGASIILKGANGTSGIRSLDDYPKIAKSCSRVHSNVIAARTSVPFVLASLPAGCHQLSDAFGVSPNAHDDFGDQLAAIRVPDFCA
ncbi:DUF2264 domain-containing protein [Rhizobium wenxiniae]|uniref:DUF2264 domain-containing protein n=1 Tax=Rhizobium wenxiniae TaxID=1737357 RepID=UPI003C18B047